MKKAFRDWIRPLLYLGQNPVTLAGAVFTTSAALTLVWFWGFEILQGGPIHPYTGIVFFLVLPGVFVFGLILMPLGALARRRRLRREGRLPSLYPEINFHSPTVRKASALVGVATALNVGILGVASFRSVEYMDSVQFCGQTCHSVMAPEFTAYKGSPHSRVACVDCHIGPGAPWFVRAKISGVRQVFAVTLKTYSRPIPSPVHNLRPARETCEQCHWPQKFVGDKFIIRTHYAEDAKNTPSTNVLALKVGGRRWNGSSGIHGHHITSPERITYISTDERRQVIPVVTVTDDSGRRTEFVSTDVKVTPEQLARAERRTMDCMDCHNRPTHAYQMPATALDAAISEGAISPELPFVKKQALAALRASYADEPAAREKIAESLTEFYRASYPEDFKSHRALVENAIHETQAIWERNVFPEMKITWGTYPNNIGHDDFPGCFRCHDGNHKASDGRVIPQDCDTCHTLLAQEETNPKILADLGLK